MNYVKKLNLHWFCTQNHILEPFSVWRACTKSYVTSEPYPRASQIWCQNVRETWKKSHKVSRRELCALQSNRAKCRGGGGPVFLGLSTWKLLGLGPYSSSNLYLMGCFSVLNPHTRENKSNTSIFHQFHPSSGPVLALWHLCLAKFSTLNVLVNQSTFTRPSTWAL